MRSPPNFGFVMYEGNDHIFPNIISGFDCEPPLDHPTAQRLRIGCVSGLVPKGNEIELAEKGAGCHLSTRRLESVERKPNRKSISL